MVKIDVNNKKYLIPNNLNELTIENYKDMQSIPKDIDKYQQGSMIIGELSGMPQKIINSLDIIQFNSIINNLTLMIMPDDMPLMNIIEVNGIKYKFEDDIHKIRFDQFADLFEMTKNQSELNKNLENICAILYRKVIKVKKGSIIRNIFNNSKKNKIYITKEYNSDDIQEQAEEFKKLTMDVVFGLLFFFLNIKKIYLQNLMEYSQEEKLTQN